MLLRLSYLFLLLAIAAGAFFYVYFSRQNDSSPAYVGSERCGVCHTPASIGSQYRLWQTSPHSKAYSVLQEDSVQSFLKRTNLGMDSCLSCHTTLGRASNSAPEQQLNAEGIGCERCHGPGSEYSFYNIMTDRPAFLTQGGVAGGLKDCAQCHATDLTTMPHCPFQTEAFNADSAWQSISHPVPPKRVEPDTVKPLRES